MTRPLRARLIRWLLYATVPYVLIAGVAAALSFYFEHREARKTAEERAAWPAFYEAYDRANARYEEGAYVDARPAIDSALASAIGQPDFPAVRLTEAYVLKADVHIALWQYVDAAAVIREALLYADDEQRATLEWALADVEGRIKANDNERELQQIYHATPSTRPARSLDGRVLVVYVFVDDGATSRWGARARGHTLASLDGVERWIGTWGDVYGVDKPEFVRRVFMYDRDPWLRNALTRIDAQHVDVGYDLAKRIARLEGRQTVRAFLDGLASEADADHVVLLIHIRADGRSYAMPCYGRCPEAGEYAYLIRGAARNEWEQVAYLQAHEALHLFGADDLYNLRGGEVYAPRDIMHYRSSMLGGSTIDSLTAFSIGWSFTIPRTPFPVQTHPGRR